MRVHSSTAAGRNTNDQQIALHEAKIDNPAAYAADWGTRSVQAQEGLLRYWAKEVANYAEQQSIVEELLYRRGH